MIFTEINNGQKFGVRIVMILALAYVETTLIIFMLPDGLGALLTDKLTMAR